MENRPVRERVADVVRPQGITGEQDAIMTEQRNGGIARWVDRLEEIFKEFAGYADSDYTKRLSIAGDDLPDKRESPS
jgi:hypothetical protein